MSDRVKILLLIGSILFFLLLLMIVRKMKISTDIAVMWLILSLVILVFAIWPDLMISLARMSGMMSPAHAVFLLFILVLLIITLFLSIRLSVVEKKLREYIQHTAIDEKDKK